MGRELAGLLGYLTPDEVVRLDGLLCSSHAFRRAYWRNPVAFVNDCIEWPDGEGPTPYQEEALDALVQHGRVCVRSPHGVGKTALASWAMLWFALTRDGEDWKVVATASAWRQLSRFLFPELRKWARLIKWNKTGRARFDGHTELLSLSLRLMTGEAFAVASDNPALIEGAHAQRLLYVFDEAKAIPPDIWDAAEGAFAAAGQDTSAEAFALAVSTPGPAQGRFYDIMARRPGYEDWWTRHVTLTEAIAAGRVSQEWAEARARQWGVTSAVYQARVLGEFATVGEDSIIPLAWVEAAVDRWREWEAAGKPGDFAGVGVDVGISGDKSVLALRFGNAIDVLRVYGPLNPETATMIVVGHVAGVLNRHLPPAPPPAPVPELVAAFAGQDRYGYGKVAQKAAGDEPPAQKGQAVVDVIGIGAGVLHRLREQGYPAVAFNASEATGKRDATGELGFVNKRSAAWWNMRELLDPDSGADIALPPDDTLIGDLTAPRMSDRILSSGKIAVESKEEIRKRLGRSTDCADAVIQAFWREPRGVFFR